MKKNAFFFQIKVFLDTKILKSFLLVLLEIFIWAKINRTNMKMPN